MKRRKKVKKKSILLMVLLFGVACIGCSSNQSKVKTVYGDTYIYRVLSENEAAIGDLKLGNRVSTYFVPVILDGYRVTQLGYQSGLVSIGNGSFSQDSSDIIVERFYYPYTIERINDGYLLYARNSLDVMYCGTVVDIAKLNIDGHLSYYVPVQDYESYLEIFSGDRNQLKKANVIYDLNYENYEYYYVDYVEETQKIENIPPSPSREGYSFEGWYKENTFLQQWDFTTDMVLLEEGVNELRLYAKWKRNEVINENN